MNIAHSLLHNETLQYPPVTVCLHKYNLGNESTEDGNFETIRNAGRLKGLNHGAENKLDCVVSLGMKSSKFEFLCLVEVKVDSSSRLSGGH